jgi:predicted glycosyltransferase involved in capsule biosynthesis
MDRFPEAFERFEYDVDISRFRSYHELTLAFRWWAGERWRGTRRQWEALNAEAENLGFEVPDFVREELGQESGSGYSRGSSWRREFVKIRGKAKRIYRDLKTGRFIKKPS